jgi:hypothetical protein
VWMGLLYTLTMAAVGRQVIGQKYETWPSTLVLEGESFSPRELSFRVLTYRALGGYSYLYSPRIREG